ncbi:uncharacterized protein LOC111316303 [Durio zibethinus]|uniref:Uncharacterized protein LOC111316303 n=1 Tax=Durio zibethinus TaxID=66656 RepID=A0A6P6BAB7_DURZI|nr:uncharacterized protein LOC111316303 [Durio zibethinus]
MEGWSFRLHMDLSADQYASSFCISSPSIDEAYLNEYSPLFGSILSKEVGIPRSLESIKVKDFSIPYISWSKMDKQKLLRSLQRDFELVYVAQSCLTWEALHHQYRKVKFLIFSNSLFSDNVAGDFQNFQALLERFLEEEGFFEEEKEGIKGETVFAKVVLKAIEKCIQIFGKFKELWLKELQGKQRCWFNKAVNPVEESQKVAILFTMIEMKLVSRVLQMSFLSSSQLKWCQEKLNNIEFKRGRLFGNANGPLFPSS